MDKKIELFVPHRIALKSKERGFNEPCFGLYYADNTEDLTESSRDLVENICNFDVNLIKAPTYQQVTDWLREEHKIQIEMVSMQPDSWLITLQYINSLTPNGVYNGKRIDIDLEEPADYYKSLTIAIEEALKVI